MPLLGYVDLNTGLPVRKPEPVRCERKNPGDLLRVDMKKLGRLTSADGRPGLWRGGALANDGLLHEPILQALGTVITSTDAPTSQNMPTCCRPRPGPWRPRQHPLPARSPKCPVFASETACARFRRVWKRTPRPFRVFRAG